MSTIDVMPVPDTGIQGPQTLKLPPWIAESGPAMTMIPSLTDLN